MKHRRIREDSSEGIMPVPVSIQLAVSVIPTTTARTITIMFTGPAHLNRWVPARCHVINEKTMPTRAATMRKNTPRIPYRFGAQIECGVSRTIPSPITVIMNTVSGQGSFVKDDLESISYDRTSLMSTTSSKSSSSSSSSAVSSSGKVASSSS